MGGSAYRRIGTAGLALAVVLVMWLATALGLSRAVEALVVVAALGVLVALTAAFKVVTGEERLSSYHHQLGVLAVVAMVLAVCGQPVLRHVDVTMLGVCVFLSFGRVGCFLVGCCHGRPARPGVRYGARHAAAGFPRHLVGVRLAPVQVAEAAWLGVIVAIGVRTALREAPGTALAWYLVAYAGGRFVLELWRGDVDRPFVLGFSEAQWTAVGVTTAVAVGEIAGVLPARAWHVALAVALPLAMLVVHALDARARRLLSPRHVAEIAERLATAHAAAVAAGGVHLAVTSLGLTVSVSAIRSGAEAVDVIALSADPPLAPATARRVGRVVSHLLPSHRPARLVPGAHGVHHVVVPAAGASELAHAV